MSDIWEVEIVAADRFKTKGFQKPSTWFRVDVALITGSKWRELSANAQRLWMLTLAHGSAKGSLRVALGSTRGISADIRCKPQSIPTAVRELTKLGWLQVLAEPRARAVRTNERTNERTNVPRKEPRGSRGASQGTISNPDENAPQPPDSAAPVIAFYCEQWKTKYKSDKSPPILPQHAKSIKTVIQQVGSERAKVLIEAYLRMDERWFVTKSHDIPTMVANLTAITKFVENGETPTPNPPPTNYPRRSWAQ